MSSGVDGTSVESNAMAVVDQDLEIGGLLLVGNHVDAEGARATALRQSARRIVKIEKTPGIRKSRSNYERVVYM